MEILNRDSHCQYLPVCYLVKPQPSMIYNRYIILQICSLGDNLVIDIFLYLAFDILPL